MEKSDSAESCWAVLKSSSKRYYLYFAIVYLIFSEIVVFLNNGNLSHPTTEVLILVIVAPLGGLFIIYQYVADLPMHVGLIRLLKEQEAARFIALIFGFFLLSAPWVLLT